MNAFSCSSSFPKTSRLNGSISSALAGFWTLSTLISAGNVGNLASLHILFFIFGNLLLQKKAFFRMNFSG